MGGSSFELLLEEVQHMQRVMEELERTNRELRLQLANLRNGRGIILDIAGKRFALSQEDIRSSDSPEAHVMPQSAAAGYEAGPPTRNTAILPHAELLAQERPAQETPVTATAARSQETASESAPPPQLDEEEATFLEEMMYDEFANQMTNPMSVWTGPTATPESAEEAQKAALRRELMGSFLLE